MDDDYVVAQIVSEGERNYRERVKLRSIRDTSNPFDLPSGKFKKFYRLTREAAQYLCEFLNDPPLSKGTIPKHIKVLAALNFFAQGCYQSQIGDKKDTGLSQSSLSRALGATTDAILKEVTPEAIQFPKSIEAKEKAKSEFQQIYNMPNTLGAVDGSHVAIFKPPADNDFAPGILFYNRKGYHSINCQVVTSAKGKILSINPNFPGSTHDAAIWQASSLKRHMETEFLRGVEDQWLLGDKAYPLVPWLMTPIPQPTSAAEEAYNECHSRARNCVEMSFGRLKNKLRCLHKHRCLHYEPSQAAKIIIACCSIYNMFGDVMSSDEDEDSSDEDVNDDVSRNDSDDDPDDVELDYLNLGIEKRNSLILNYFS